MLVGEIYKDDVIRDILQNVRTIAVVGASANPARPSFLVTQYLLSKNYRLLAVNPGHAGKIVAGAPCFASLGEASENSPDAIEMIDIF